MISWRPLGIIRYIYTLIYQLLTMLWFSEGKIDQNTTLNDFLLCLKIRDEDNRRQMTWDFSRLLNGPVAEVRVRTTTRALVLSDWLK